MSKNRMEGIECNCREKESNWEDFMKKRKEILRLKIDMKHQNRTMRDPTMFRFIAKSHPRTNKKYSLWPTYDFQNAVMDGHFKITNRLRSKEFELRAELQRYIQKLLKLNESK